MLSFRHDVVREWTTRKIQNDGREKSKLRSKKKYMKQLRYLASVTRISNRINVIAFSLVLDSTSYKHRPPLKFVFVTICRKNCDPDSIAVSFGTIEDSWNCFTCMDVQRDDI